MTSKAKISNIEEIDNTLKFTISNINVSYANGIRRIILSEIPCIVIQSFPHERNNITIHANKTRLNNELLKQRISSIPIHVDDIENFPYDDYTLEIDKSNDTNVITFVTSEDIKIKNNKTEKYLLSSEVKKIFPPDLITNDFIDIVRLRPAISTNTDKEHLKLEAKFSISNAKDDGMFNVASTCSYGNTIDPIKIKDEWIEREKELKEKHTKEEIEFIKKDWLLLDGKRLFIEDSFDFIIETIGIYTNFRLVELAASILIKNIYKSLESIKTNIDLIKEIDDTMENSYHIVLENEDYTVGKILEYNLYQKYFLDKKELMYVSFLKRHPHDTFSIIKVAFKTITSKDDIIIMLEECVNSSIITLNSIKEYFSEK
jgi:DNA-directed RNA polymerase alpha subunit/DNA-directed RNA polymerase subunit L